MPVALSKERLQRLEGERWLRTAEGQQFLRSRDEAKARKRRESLAEVDTVLAGCPILQCICWMCSCPRHQHGNICQRKVPARQTTSHPP